MIENVPAQTTVEDILNLFSEHERLMRAEFVETERLMRAEFAETERLRKEAERRREQERAETERLGKEAERRREQERAETERLGKEAERRREQERAETERLREEAERRREQERAEDERQMRALRREVDKTVRAVREQGKQLGNLGNRLGQFVEELVAPAVVRLFRARGIDVREVYRRALARRNGDSMEIDVLVVNDTDVVALEAKSELDADDIEDQVDRLRRFKTMFPRYAGCRVLGAVAAMVVPVQVGRQAYQAGLFVLAPSGETMRILNDKRFKPRAW
jgi:ATPase subunit of ABC transporter with duplicated ATPase domains